MCSKRKVVRFGLCCFVDGCFQAFCKCIVCRAHPVKTIFKSTRSNAAGDWIASDIQGIAISLETAGLKTSFQWNRAEIVDDDICFAFSNFIPRKIWGSLIAKNAYVYHLRLSLFGKNNRGKSDHHGFWILIRFREMKYFVESISVECG